MAPFDQRALASSTYIFYKKIFFFIFCVNVKVTKINVITAFVLLTLIKLNEVATLLGNNQRNSLLLEIVITKTINRT